MDDFEDHNTDDEGLREKLGKDIGEAVKMATNLEKDTSEWYAPIVNSITMLEDILDHLVDVDYLIVNKDHLNVGLLAAKSLDFADKKSKEYAYATQLHDIWFDVLILIKMRFVPPTSGPRKVAYGFYKDHGYKEDSRICGHMSGIDFSFPVGIVTLHGGNIVGQWRAFKAKQGDYYSDVKPNVTPSCLGIHNYQKIGKGRVVRKIEHQHQIKDNDADESIQKIFDRKNGLKEKGVEVLKSVSAAVLDTWSIKGEVHRTKGGCAQYFNAKDKGKFEQVYP